MRFLPYSTSVSDGLSFTPSLKKLSGNFHKVYFYFRLLQCTEVYSIFQITLPETHLMRVKLHISLLECRSATKFDD